MNWPIDKGTTLGFALLLVMLLTSTGVSYYNSHQLHEHYRLLAHTREVLKSLTDAVFLLQSVETKQQDYIITGSQIYLEDYLAATDQLPTALQRLAQVTVDNPLQQTRVAALKQRIEERVAFAAKAIDMRRTQGFEAAQQFVLSSAGARQADAAIQAQAAALEQAEQEQLQSYAREVQRSYENGFWAQLVATLLGLSLISLTIYFTGRDFAMLRRTEQALRERETYFRELADRAPVMLWLTDPSGRCTYLNQRWFDYTGATLTQDEGYDWLASVHPEDRRMAGEIFLKANQRRENFSLDYRLKGHDGQYHWALDAGEPRFDAKGEFLGYIGAVIDISERKRAEEALRQSTAILNAVNETTPTLIFVKDRQGRLSLANPATCRVIGKPLADLIGKTDAEYLGNRLEAERIMANDQRVMETGRVDTFEECVQTPDGVHTFLSIKSPYRDEKGAVTGLIGVAVDISQRKRMEEALKEADRRKDEFLAMLAHELRNPLAPIRNAAQVLQLLSPAEPKLQWVQKVINRQVEHLARLVDDLLDVSRITRGKITLQKETFELNALIERAVETSRPLIEARRHQLSVALPVEPVRIAGDLTRLAQVVANLLNNAAKFTPPGGQIGLTAERKEGEVIVRVKDTGVGINAALLPQVFDLFTQAEQTLDRSQGGLGLGLALVRHLVEMHGGCVAAYSEGPGQGAEFVVRLPSLAAPLSDTAPRAGSERAEVARLRILIVEDNEDVAESLALLLKLEGHEISKAADGVSALAAAAAFQPSVVLLDIGLPGMDGYQIARQLRQQPALRNALLVAITGYGQAEDRKQAQEAGFDHYLIKPLDPEALRAVLASRARLKQYG